MYMHRQTYMCITVCAYLAIKTTIHPHHTHAHTHTNTHARACTPKHERPNLYPQVDRLRRTDRQTAS